MQRGDSVFIKGNRFRINVVGIVVNVFSPWLVFFVLLFLYTSKLHFRYPSEVKAFMHVLAGAVLIAVGSLAVSWTRGYSPQWYKASFVLHALAIIGAYGYGSWNYVNYIAPYYSLEKLQAYPNLDVVKTKGATVQDAGRVNFAAGTKIDSSRSWHFRAGALYCVAPIIGQDGQETVDFWAVGKGCCSESSPDFRCGEGDTPALAMLKARSGLRFLETDYWNPERHFYRLAVNGAEANFGIKAPEPLFFYWTQDPLYTMMTLRDKGWGNFIVGIESFGVFVVAFVCFATCRFAFIGRAPERSRDDYEDL
jgi:hypothetical protein